MPITTNDIAKLAKVSQATVSRCLNNSPLVSEKTKQKIKKIAQEHGFQFNANARGLSTSRSGSIGLISPTGMVDFGFDVHHRYWTHQLIENLERLEFDVIVSFPENRFTGKDNIKKLISAKKVDGLIIMQQNISIETLSFLEKSDIPFVFAKYLPDICFGRNVDYVHVDQFKGGYLAGQHLLNDGHQRIMCISADIEGGEFKLRTEGYRAAFRDSGVTFDEKMLFMGDTSFMSAVKIVKENVAQLKKVTAIFAQTDLMALGVITVLKEQGIRVPDHIAVVGYDDIELGTYFTPYLTTIHQPIKEIASLACKRITELLSSNGSNVRQQLAIQPRLVIRDSCGSDKNSDI